MTIHGAEINGVASPASRGRTHRARACWRAAPRGSLATINPLLDGGLRLGRALRCRRLPAWRRPGCREHRVRTPMRHLPATEEGAGTGDHRKAVTGSRHARRTGRACPGPRRGERHQTGDPGIRHHERTAAEPRAATSLTSIRRPSGATTAARGRPRIRQRSVPLLPGQPSVPPSP